MKGNFFQLFLFCASVITGYIAIYVIRGSATLNAVYTDSHGDTYRVPSDGLPTKIMNAAINGIPRFNNKFQIIPPLFDLDNKDYLDSSIMYILLVGAVGLLFFVIVGIFFICRYACGCCGGKVLPKRGYSQTVINSVRISLLIFSFIFEGILIYGYFANTDLHKALHRLVDYFQVIGDRIDTDMNLILEKIDSLGDKTSYNYMFDLNKEDFKTDLLFSTHYAIDQTRVMKKFVDKVEMLRMALILLNLILSTVGCAVGIAAGSVMRGFVMVIMVWMNTVSTVFFFFSTGCHFAGAKIIYEYCDEISYYIKDSNYGEQIPMRLQFFIPCVNSPLFAYINDYFAQDAISSIDALRSSIQSSEALTEALENSPPFWFNITDDYYKGIFGAMTSDETNRTIEKNYEESLKQSIYLQALTNQNQCIFSKNEMKSENFLMCSYTKDNLDMLTLTQAIGCLLVVIITCIGLPAIRKFAWAGANNMGGVLDGGKNKYIGNKAKAKRNVS